MGIAYVVIILQYSVQELTLILQVAAPRTKCCQHILRITQVPFATLANKT